MSLVLENISISYGEHIVTDGLNLSVPEASIIGLAGINGAGKTSLLNVIAGRLKPLNGTVQWKGKNPELIDISYLESSLYFYPRMTGHDYIDLFSTGDNFFRREEWNSLFNLPLDDYVVNYSSGMQKKLALIGIAAQDRPVLLLDEPFNALDLDSVEILKRILPALRNKGKTILLTSHIFETLTKTCDTVHLLSEGRIENSYSRDEYHILENELNHHTSTKFDGMINKIFR